MKKKAARHMLLIAVALLLIIASTAAAAPYGSRSLHTGSFGNDVTALQQRLTALGYNPGQANGVFGAETQQALQAFQQTYGLTPDGMASKWTYKALDQAYQWVSNHQYTVQAGDSLWLIAQNQGATVDALMSFNQLTSTDLYPGQVLRIPAAGTKAGLPVPPSVLAAPPVPPIPVKSTPPATPRTVLGYYAEDWEGDTRSLSSLQNSLQQVNLAVNFELAIGADGGITARSYPALMATAQQQGVKVQGLVHNLTGSGFDPAVATAILADPAVRSTAVQNLVGAAQQYGLSGINVDLENVPPSLRPDYTAFVQALDGALKQAGLGLTLSVPAKTADVPGSPWTGAFDYAALAPYADKIVIMAYDEHLPGFPSGPIASAPWVEQVAAYVVTQIPPEKVLLGVPAYAYNWVQGTTTGIAMSVPNALNAARQYNATILWDPTALVPYFTYTNSSGQSRIVYFENAQSTSAKLAIMRKYNLGGIALWRLGLEDPGIWPVIAQQVNW